jgi:hypothetical protein
VVTIADGEGVSFGIPARRRSIPLARAASSAFPTGAPPLHDAVWALDARTSRARSALLRDASCTPLPLGSPPSLESALALLAFADAGAAGRQATLICSSEGGTECCLVTAVDSESRYCSACAHERKLESHRASRARASLSPQTPTSNSRTASPISTGDASAPVALAGSTAPGPAVLLFRNQLATSLALFTAESSLPLLNLLERSYAMQLAFTSSQLFALRYVCEPSVPGSVALSHGIRWPDDAMEVFVHAFRLGIFSHLRRFSLFMPAPSTVADHLSIDICENSLDARVVVIKEIWERNGASREPRDCLAGRRFVCASVVLTPSTQKIRPSRCTLTA